MAYWWVNHKQTRDQEIGGDYLWSPKANANGARNQTYDNMARARQGDVVFSYAGGVLGAVGVVRADASTAPKPIEFGRTGSYWANEGWFLPVEFSKATSSVRPKDHLGLIAPLLPPRHSPIQPNGNGNQGVYLTGISDALGQLLVALTGMADRLPAMEAPADILSWQVMDDIAQIKAEAAIPSITMGRHSPPISIVTCNSIVHKWSRSDARVIDGDSSMHGLSSKSRQELALPARINRLPAQCRYSPWRVERLKFGRCCHWACPRERQQSALLRTFAVSGCRMSCCAARAVAGIAIRPAAHAWTTRVECRSRFATVPAGFPDRR